MDEIWVPYGYRSKLAAHFNVSMQTVRAALKYASHTSKLHDDIRREALEKFDGYKVKMPSVVTT